MRFGRSCETPNIGWQLTLDFRLVVLCSSIFIPPMLNDFAKSLMVILGDGGDTN